MKYLDELKPEDLENKKVLLRVDFNVPPPDGNNEIEAFRIRAHKQTLGFLLDSGVKIALVSHIDPPLESFDSLVEQISTALGQTITLVPHSALDALDTMLQECPVVLIDNLRQDPREEQNDERFAMSLSKGFDYYINDAFSVCHRNHASVSAITKHLPSYAGFLVKKEIENLSKAVGMPTKGKILVLGGAKISTKLPVIKNFLDKAEKILIGGAIANDFFQAQGINVGSSLVDASVMPNLTTYDVVRLPEDVIISKSKTGDFEAEPYPVKDLSNDHLILDIGPETAKHFAEIIKNSSLVIWNGPMGLAEVEKFSEGTKTVAQAMAEAKHSIIGGGDTIAVVDKFKLLDKFSYVSTGGGAMLAFLANEKLPGLQALGYYAP